MCQPRSSDDHIIGSSNKNNLCPPAQQVRSPETRCVTRRTPEAQPLPTSVSLDCGSSAPCGRGLRQATAYQERAVKHSAAAAPSQEEAKPSVLGRCTLPSSKSATSEPSGRGSCSRRCRLA